MPIVHRKSTKLQLLLSILTILLTLTLSACTSTPQVHKATIFALDTVLEITAYGPQAPLALEQAQAEIKTLEKLLDTHNPASEIAQLNSQAGIAPVNLSPATFEVLQQAQFYAQQTAGAFDPTIKPLADLWALGKTTTTVPIASEIQQALKLVNFRRLQLNPETKTAFLLDKQMGVDLGGVAKNYILLKVRSLLLEHQITSALINGGGDIYTIGQNPNGKPWIIGVQHPRKNEGIIATVNLNTWDQVATSGDYQRFFIVNEQRYHHIFDLKTGYPTTSLSSATIFSRFPEKSFPSSLCLILGKDASLEFIKNYYPNVQVLFVDQQQQVTCTADLTTSLALSN